MKASLAACLVALVTASTSARPALQATPPSDAKPLPRIETSSPGGVVVSSANGRWVRERP